ncbi:unnamed protein product [Meloidogyne enterolobii]|uniref:Uncharacterized protein n=1 Tax=Meloidogyne enterolobii TaxID=390850 RepID=A0ACB1B7Z6_MELEN
MPIENAWQKQMTTRQNLASMGLAYDPNEVAQRMYCLSLNKLQLMRQPNLTNRKNDKGKKLLYIRTILTFAKSCYPNTGRITRQWLAIL